VRSEAENLKPNRTRFLFFFLVLNQRAIPIFILARLSCLSLTFHFVFCLQFSDSAFHCQVLVMVIAPSISFPNLCLHHLNFFIAVSHGDRINFTILQWCFSPDRECLAVQISALQTGTIRGLKIDRHPHFHPLPFSSRPLDLCVCPAFELVIHTKSRVCQATLKLNI
jgi:hypothetical protein